MTLSTSFHTASPKKQGFSIRMTQVTSLLPLLAVSLVKLLDLSELQSSKPYREVRSS